MRIKFPKNQQRKFIQEVLKKMNCPSLRSLRQRGFDIKYSCLKNYYLEYRLMPENLVRDLCLACGINFNELKVEILDEIWGQRKGGRVSKK
ncbi:hypothetical protein J4474_03185 [Candidatus Pacearchaeota archaeon]|nr:hypothetical protein [Candidatus Pacearchaeota archaeon]